ncbi:MAG: ATP-binding protein [Candidatus Bathyarchaeaceae archaeon]
MIVTIMILQFVDRQDELQALNGLLTKKKAALVLLYGRRRVGKTRLIQEFMKDKRGLYFYVPNAEEKAILAEFSRVVEIEFFEGFRFVDFASFMEYLVKKCGANGVVAFDEFQRLTNIGGAISMLQKYWDEKLSKTKCLLILSGSSIGAIRRVALRGDAPLYGRRTATMKIEPLKYLDLFQWFKKYSAEELVTIYGSFGGTPAYLEHIDNNLTVEENIVEKILSKRSPLHDEPEMLLMEEIRAPQRYMDILSVIALGKNTISEIADATGLSRENATTYIKTLEILDLIERITPVTEPEAKRGLYKIRDPFFGFWFGFVRPNKRQLELGLEKNVWQNSREGFKAHLGRIFEDIGTEILVEMTKQNLLPVKVEKIGKWWWKETEIDIVGLESKGKKALAIEAKLTKLNYQEAKRLLSELTVKAKQIHNVKECTLGVIAKKIEDKEKIRNEGFIAFDVEDMANLRKQKD